MTAGVDTAGLPCHCGQSGPGRVQWAAWLGLRKWEPSGPSWRRGWERGLLHPAVTPETPGAQSGHPSGNSHLSALDPSPIQAPTGGGGARRGWPHSSRASCLPSSHHEGRPRYCAWKGTLRG